MRILAKSMKLSVLVVVALAATSVYAQGPGGFPGHGRGSGWGKNHTPPTPAQLAADELTMVARSLKLDSAQTSALTGNAGLVTDLTTEQNTLQANGKIIQAAYKALATDVATGKTSDEVTQENTIETTNTLSLQARVTAAGQVLTALPGLSSTQATRLAQMLIGGGFGGGFRR